jgi:hypothetical protein
MERTEEEFAYQEQRRYLLGIDDNMPPVAPAGKEPRLRNEAVAKERCQAAALLLWKQNPAYTTTELSTHPDVRNEDVTGGKSYQPRTIYDWIAEVDPRPRKGKVGRPVNVLKDRRK